MQRLKFFLIACIAIPLSRLPLSWLQFIGSWLGKALIYLNPKRTHIVQRNLEVCFPKLEPVEQKQLLRATAIETGKWFMEAAYTWYGQPQRLINAVNVKKP